MSCFRLVPLREILWKACEVDATGMVPRESESRLASGAGVFRNRNRHSTVAADCVTWRGRKRKNTDVPDVPVGEYADIVRAEGGRRLQKKKRKDAEKDARKKDAEKKKGEEGEESDKSEQSEEDGDEDEEPKQGGEVQEGCVATHVSAHVDRGILISHNNSY